MDEDTVVIHLGKVVDEELLEEIAQYLSDKMTEKYSWLFNDQTKLT